MEQFRMSIGRWILPALALVVCAGCADQNRGKIDRAVSDYGVGNYAHAQQVLAPLAEKTDENFVLNNCRLGSAALARYDLDTAEKAFLNAYEVINSVGVNDGGRGLGAVVVTESIKVWKGEPFERAMANFYLGVVYYMKHDYGNARAAFENALFKLRDYGSGKETEERYEEVENNFPLGLIMLGKCWQRLGRDDLAKQFFDRVSKTSPQLGDIVDLGRNAQSNVLLLVDFGYGPQKIRTSDGDIVGFGPLPGEAGPVPPPVVMVDGRPIRLD
ncbi:MAG TPA: hypothetical protein VIL86_07965, partial [Tepidisphaeraceae bacterium]